ncbi:hypothetical protein JHK82_051130 [Glycine max]|nr:hypothetical protein JHK82_051130 [Glycine max]
MESEMSPGGMFVQRREAAAAADNGSAAGNDNMTTPEEQRLFFGGKEKDNEGHLHAEGVRDMSKLLLLEDASSEERKHEEIRKHNEMLKASEAVAEVSVLEVAVDRGTRVSDKEFLMFTELLMRQLLKLDGIEAEGEVKLQRKAELFHPSTGASCAELCRYTRFSEGKELQPLYYHCKAVSVATQWETFDSGMGSLNAPTSMTSSRNVIQDW